MKSKRFDRSYKRRAQQVIRNRRWYEAIEPIRAAMDEGNRRVRNVVMEVLSRARR